MANARAIIQKTTLNGPWTYSFVADVESPDLDTVVTNVASAGAAIDAIKVLVGALPGTLHRVTVSIQTT